jgi:hypothetical protein
MKTTALKRTRLVVPLLAGLMAVWPLSGCMHQKVETAVAEANAAMLSPLLISPESGISTTTRDGVSAKLMSLIELNEANPDAANRLRVRHAMLQTAGITGDGDAAIASAAWLTIVSSHLSGRDLALWECRDPLVFWFGNSKKVDHKFWPDDALNHIATLKGYIATLTGSLGRLPDSSTTKIYLGDIRADMHFKVLVKMKEVGQSYQQEDRNAFKDYLDLQPAEDIGKVRDAAATRPADSDKMDDVLFGGAVTAKKAYRSYAILSRIRMYGSNGLLADQHLPPEYQWVTSVR